MGIGLLSDDTPISRRYYEAQAPSPLAPLSSRIKSSTINPDLSSLEIAISSTLGVEDVVTRLRSDGTPEAFVTMHPPNSAGLKQALSELLPGYEVPDRLHVFPTPLMRTSFGGIDYNAMEKQAANLAMQDASPHELLVRDIISQVLHIDPSGITPESDFFLLGGNSLLLGKLAYHIRKQAGINVSVPSMFANSTVTGIASLFGTQDRNFYEESLVPSEMESESDTLLGDSASSFDAWGDFGSIHHKSRGQTHPFVLFIQALPFIFSSPLKSALTCE